MNSRRLLVKAGMALCLTLVTACPLAKEDTTGTSSRMVRENGIALDGEAETNYEKLKALLDAIREERKALCPRNEELLTEISGELQEIHESTLSNAEKAEEARAVFERYRSDLEADRASVQACVNQDEATRAEFDELRTSEMALLSACLPKPVFARQHGGGLPPPRLNMDDVPESQAAKIEEQLESDACDTAVK